MDQQLTLLSVNLLGCLTRAVTGNPNPPEVIGYRVEFEPPEELWPQDLCCRGLAYLTMGDVWPSVTSFPEADIVQQIRGNCPPPTWGIQFRLGIMRCVSAELNVTETHAAEDYFQDLHDAQALRAVTCCVRDYLQTEPTWWGMNVVVERQQKTVQGGCKDRYQQISVQVPNCEC